MSSRGWLEIAIECEGAEIRARARGSRGEQTAPHSLGPELTREQLSLFTQRVREAAERAEPLGDTLHQAQVLYQSLLRGDIRDVMVRLEEAERDRPLLVRLLLGPDGSLQAFPWEALCEPEATAGFLGNLPNVLLARGVMSTKSTERTLPREPKGAIRVLAIAPSADGNLTGLRSALEESISAGAIEWLAPLLGPRASFDQISQRLKQAPIPHIIHFIGHGGVDENGEPQLRLADEDGEEKWSRVELLAQDLWACFRNCLRLVVLDACEGARPGALASAAEWLVRNGADAVVAHLWPVKADITRACSRVFYKTLTGRASLPGDVAFSLNAARREMLDRFQKSAEAFSPVLYLRGSESILFDFTFQRLTPPLPGASVPRADTPAPALYKLLRQPFTLVLGDRWKDERVILDGFCERLRQALLQEGERIPAGLSLSSLAQRYELQFEEERLDKEFQDVFGHAAAEAPLIGALARKLKPGVHITLQRLPVLEMALARHQPERTLYVIQPPKPGRSEVTVLRRGREGNPWDGVSIRQLPDMLDPEQDLIVLRLYRGYLPPSVFMRPLLTEDDYLLGVTGLDTLLGKDLADPLMGVLNTRPALILGISMLEWHHRILLYRLFGPRPLQSGSMVVLEPGERERELWERRRIRLAEAGIEVLELSATDLVGPFQAAVQGESQP